MTKRKDEADFLEEAKRIEREEIQIEDEEAEGRWVFVRPRPPKEPSQVYSVRLPATAVEELRLLASARDEAPTGLIRDWVLERLDAEVERLPSRGKGSGRKRQTRRAAKSGRKKSASTRRSTSRAKSKRGTTGARSLKSRSRSR